MKGVHLILSRSAGKISMLSMILLASCSFIHAQVRFSASGPSSVPVNQNFQVDYTIEGGEAKTLQPSFADFQVLSGPNYSSQLQISNNGASQTVTYSYILHPKKEGTFKIGKAKAGISGVIVESNELTVTVTGPAQQQPQQRRRDPFFDPFGDDDPFEQMRQMQQAQQPQKSTAEIEKSIHDNVIVRMETDKSSVYIGEPIKATIKIYFKLGIAQFGVSKAPSFDGFWSQEVPQDTKEPKRRIETYNGQQYNVVDYMRYNLYAQRSGTLQITPADINMVVQASIGRSVWGDQLANVPAKTNTNGLTINVKEVPTAGKPADYNGAVGKFNYQVKISSKDGKTDNALTYTVRISGTGNLKTIELPKPQFPEGFEVFDPKVKDDVSNSAAGMNGSIQYDYLIIPHQPGDYTIPGSSFSYFDPSAGKYFSQSSPDLALTIKGAASQNPNAGQSALVNKEDVSALHSDIRFIKTRIDLQKTSKPLFGSLGYTGLVSTPFLLFVGLIFVRRRNEDLAADLIGAKRRRATKLAKKRLSTADKHLAKNDKPAFYDEVSRAMWGYLGDKLNIDHSQLSKDNVEEKLLVKNVNTETIAKLKSLINTCELALYSPIGAGDEMRQNYNAAIELIADLEDEIK